MGFDGYDAVRDIYAERIRRGESEFSGKAEALVARRRRDGDGALAAELIETLCGHIETLTDADVLRSLTSAASVLVKARRINVLGFRSSYPVACHFAYVLSLVGGDVHLLDGLGGTGPDALRASGPDDAMLAVSVQPYTRAAIELVDYSIGRGLAIVAVTDSRVLPLVCRACASIIVPTANPSLFHTMTPAFAATEALAAILAARAGERALDAVREMERRFVDLSTHI